MANYQTETVRMWLHNDEGLYSYWYAEAEALVDDNFDDREEAKIRLAERMAAGMNADNPDELREPHRELLADALQQVDWHEIADEFIADVP